MKHTRRDQPQVELEDGINGPELTVDDCWWLCCWYVWGCWVLITPNPTNPPTTTQLLHQHEQERYHQVGLMCVGVVVGGSGRD